MTAVAASSGTLPQKSSMGASDNIAPFEGPEKLLEIWFAPYASAVPPVLDHPDAVCGNAGRIGLRAVKREVWEDMLAIVKCKVLSVVEGAQMDAYLLSESSFFVFPHKLILKTCGTTLNLLGLPRILDVAAGVCGMPAVWRCFYSRKSFMFPERQSGPHREWSAEVEFLDAVFKDAGGGAAYTVGKVNGDHWLLYMTTPREHELDLAHDDEDAPEDYTIELLMSDLAPETRAPFFTADLDMDGGAEDEARAKAHALALSDRVGITSIFPHGATTLDAYSFVPCGYSANALVTLPPDDASLPHQADEGYYTIHVTPEEGWSYASFECNVQLSTAPSPAPPPKKGKARMPDLQTLVQRVVQIFQPGRLSVTLFVSAPSSRPPSPVSTASNTPYTSGSESNLSSSVSSLSSVESAEARADDGDDDDKEKDTPRVLPTVAAPGLAHAASMLALDTTHDHFPVGEVESAQRAFLQALAARGYRRTDKINYEFGGYDLAFASFERKKARPPPAPTLAA